jgi:hypothetical protein
VLRVQLRRDGDASAVIETPGGFLLYVAKEKTDTALTVVCLSLPKRSYEEWPWERGEQQSRERFPELPTTFPWFPTNPALPRPIPTPPPHPSYSPLPGVERA